MKSVVIIIFCASFLTGCSKKTEQYLRAVNKADTLNFAALKARNNESMVKTFTEGIEYGKISFPNADTIKYLFMSHHVTNDAGGTLFILPDGKSKFIEGYFCCEFELPNGGDFSSAKAFMKKMEKLDGISP